MNRTTFIGGMIGFGLAVFAGMLSEGGSWPGILLRGCMGALAGGLLFRRWSGLFPRSIGKAGGDPLPSQASALRTNSPAPTTRQRL